MIYKTDLLNEYTKAETEIKKHEIVEEMNVNQLR